uniref:Uncharacterized protein n=1 Tax=Anopheles albimanus TaxID=7167 RepID=A0A182FKU1_ANOAL
MSFYDVPAGSTTKPSRITWSLISGCIGTEPSGGETGTETARRNGFSRKYAHLGRTPRHGPRGSRSSKQSKDSRRLEFDLHLIARGYESPRWPKDDTEGVETLCDTSVSVCVCVSSGKKAQDNGRSDQRSDLEYLTISSQRNQ